MSFHLGWMLESRMMLSRTWDGREVLIISARRYTFHDI
jgi:hypothetical protein